MPLRSPLTSVKPALSMAYNASGVTAGQVVRQQGECDGGQARAREGDDLRREKPTIRPIPEW